jgi:hypothetical protein
VSAVDRRAAATYYVAYRLTERGFDASPMTGAQADLMACSADGRRVVLLRVRTRERGSGFAMTALDRRPAGRNVAYAFVDFEPANGSAEPVLSFLRAEHVRKLLEERPAWSGDASALGADCREAWHLMGLSGHSSVRSASVVSSSPAL